MGFRIQNNISALNASRHLGRNSKLMDRSLERLSSGYRINSGADDAAGLASSMRFRGEISSLKVASRNAAEATSLLQVAEGAMSQVDLILNRMKELATQAASGNAGADLSKIDAEATQLEQEIERIVNFTKYNDSRLLDGNFGATSLSASTAPVDFTSDQGVENIDVNNAAANTTFNVTDVSTTAQTLTMSDGTISQTVSLAAAAGLGVNENTELNFSQLGIKIAVNDTFWDTVTADAIIAGTSTISTGATGNASFQIGNENDGNNRLGFTLGDLNLDKLRDGSSSADVDLSSQSTAQTALGVLDDAIGYLATQRGLVGTYINRFTYTQSNLAVSIENKTASESIIRDVDMASEMGEFTKNQILVQASTAMLAQANATPQNVLSLIR